MKRELSKLGDIAEKGHRTGGQQLTASVLEHLQKVIETIDDLVPFLQLALQIRNNVSSNLPANISHGRLLQASSAVSIASSRYAAHCQFGSTKPPDAVPVGPSFPARIYSLFQSSARAKHYSDLTWKEEMAKASIRVRRVAASLSMLTEEERSSAAAASLRSRISYEIQIVENLNDGRYHEELEGKTVESVDIVAGRTKVIPVADMRSLYYTHSGKLLNIDAKAPVMVVKIRGQGAFPLTHEAEGTPLRTKENVEWLAFELWQEEEEENGDDNDDDNDDDDIDDKLAQEDEATPSNDLPKGDSKLNPRGMPQERTSTEPISRGFLSILEYILRLTTLEVAEQRSHLDVPDEILTLYLANEIGSRRGGSDMGGLGGRAHAASSLREQQAQSLCSPLARKPGGTRFLDRIQRLSDGDNVEKAE